MRDFFRVNITPFLWLTSLLLMATFILMSFDSLRSIKSLGERASEVLHDNLPKIIEKQQSSLNISSLRRLAEVVYVSGNAHTRRLARIEAIALANQSIFHESTTFHKKMKHIAERIEDLTGRRDASDLLKVRLKVLADAYFRSVVDLTSRIADVEDVRRILEAYSETSLPSAGITRDGNDGMQRLGTATGKDTGNIAFIARQCQKYALRVPSLDSFCERQQDLYKEYITVQKDFEKRQKSIYDQWKLINNGLHELLDDLNSVTEFESIDALESIVRLSEKTLFAAVYIFAFGICCFIIYLFLLHRHIVRPIRWIGHKLAEIQEGSLHSSVPKIRIAELHHVAALLDRFGFYLADLTSHASLMAEDAAKKHDLEALMRAVFQLSVDGYCVWGPEGLDTANKELLRLLGVSDTTALEEHWKACGLTDWTTLRGDMYKDIIASGFLRREVYIQAVSGESIPFEISSLPVERQGTLCILSYFRDLREQKQTEEALRAAKIDAEGAARVKSEFLARMSHEIRTPMNGVLGMTQLALADNPPAAQKQYLEKIRSSARILLRVINDILDFSKMESGHVALENVRFSLSAMLSSVVGMFEAQVKEKKLAFVLETDGRIPEYVVGDELRLSQVLFNVCGNALKFTEQGGVTLRTVLVEENDEKVTLCFSVIDSGVGMTQAQLAGLFQPFAQADSSTTRKYGGTGLGLVISKLLVEMMHGRIDVTSEPGRGSTFRFTVALGRASGREEEAECPPSEGSLTALRGKRILLVEDNEINKEIAVALLKTFGCTVLVASNGAQCLELLETHVVDGILMDVQMPVMDGLAATRKIRESGHPEIRHVPIIAMTAHAMPEDKAKSLAAGMNDHITKPFDVLTLRATLLRWLVVENRRRSPART